MKNLLFVLLLLVSSVSYGAGRVFYDGFEDGTTNLWSQVDFRNKCQALTSPGDGGVGPQSGSYLVRCNHNGTLEWNDPARFETLHVSPVFGNEYLLRVYIRTSPNLTSTGALGDNTGPKLLRFFGGTYAGFLGQEDVNPGTDPVDLAWSHESPGSSYSQYGIGEISRTDWTKYEMYFNKTTDVHRIWIDDVLVRDVASEDLAAFNGAFDLTSNWSGADGTRVHDSTNYTFFDEVEIFSESGIGGTGSLSAGTMTQDASDTTPPIVSGCTPSGQLSNRSSTTMACTTDENATCRWSTISGVEYASMTNTFSTTGALSHSTTLTGLSGATSYNRYIRCRDESGNVNISDTTISFGINLIPPTDFHRNP